MSFEFLERVTFFANFKFQTNVDCKSQKNAEREECNEKDGQTHISGSSCKREKRQGRSRVKIRMGLNSKSEVAGVYKNVFLRIYILVLQKRIRMYYMHQLRVLETNMKNGLKEFKVNQEQKRFTAEK